MNYTEFVQYLLLTIAVVLTVINVFSFHEGERAIPAFLAWLGFAFLTGAMTLAGLGLWLTIGFLWSLVRWGLLCEEYKFRTKGTLHAKDWQYLKVGDFAGEMLQAFLFWPLSILRVLRLSRFLMKLNPYTTIRNRIFIDFPKS